MNVEPKITKLKSGSDDLSIAERAALACRAAEELEKAGEYEAAFESLSAFWPDRHAEPKLDDLDDATRGEVLLRVGALSGWLGTAGPHAGKQEMAKDLITRSTLLFEKLGESERLAEAHSELALCYWREGSFDEARIHLRRALRFLADERSELAACILIRAGLVELRAGRLNEALHFHNKARAIVEESGDSFLKGAFHNQLATLYENLRSNKEVIDDYTDKALIEYAAASFHFEQAGNTRYLASVENNLGFLLFTIGRNNDAHKHLDRARHLFFALNDMGKVAQVDDTRARTLLAEGRVAEAERVARYAVHTLQKGDEHAHLAEALTTYGVIHARLAKHGQARNLLDRAIKTAETTGDLEGAGRARLSILEELYGQTPDAELAAVYLSAGDLLQHSEDPATAKRLLSCSRKLIELLTAEPPEIQAATVTSWENFSIKKAVHQTERALIQRALKEAGGSVSRAAYLLGFKHHQSLISIMNLRHRDLLTMRSAVRRRRIPLSQRPRRGRPPKVRPPSAVSILHVEADENVAGMLGEMFSAEGWRVERCSDGRSALKKLAGKEHYDLLLFDNELPDLRGLELVLRASSMAHRRSVMIVLLSEDRIEAAAFRAGVDEFLRKPQDLPKVPATIARLLRLKSKSK